MGSSFCYTPSMETGERKFVLFDFDGVIADSFNLAFEAALGVHPHFTEAEYRARFDGNIYANRDRSQCTDLCQHHEGAYWALYTPRILEIQLVSGMREVVERIASRYTLAIISSSLSMDIMALLERHVITQHFSDVFGKDVHTSKVEKINIILSRYEISAADCVFVTDTLGDMREARAAEVTPIGVSWGFQDRATLEKGEPFRIVEQPRELPQAVDDFFEMMSH
jgi:phosphoglycolate phosphatase